MYRLMLWYLSRLVLYAILAALGSFVISFMFWAIISAIYNVRTITVLQIWGIVFFFALLIVTIREAAVMVVTVIRISDLQHSFSLSFDESFDACISYDLLRKLPKSSWSRGLLLEEIHTHRIVEAIINL